MSLVTSLVVFNAGRRLSHLDPNGDANARRAEFRYSVWDAFVRVFPAGGVNDNDGSLRFDVNDRIVRYFDRIVYANGSPLFASRCDAGESFSSLSYFGDLCRNLLRGVEVARRASGTSCHIRRGR